MASASYSATTELDRRYREVRRVTLIGSIVDLVLGVTKIAAGWIGQSQALIADGVHSLSDLATDFLVLFAAKLAHQEADEDHPYGHGRIETAATVGLGIALIVVAAGIAFDAVHRMFNPDLLLHPGMLAFVVAAISVASKELIYRYTMHYARRLRSNLLEANAWHSRSDAVSSIVVMVGVAGSMAGLPYVDAVAAVGVALMIAKIGWDFAWSSVRELVDTGLDPERVEALKNIIMSVDGVRQMHLLRTRKMGGRTLVDVHLLLDDPRLSVSEGHQISETVRARLIKSDDDVIDVTVHIDPEDDEDAAPNKDLALRNEVLARLERRWASIEGASDIKRVTLHYLNGKIDVEVMLPLALAAEESAAQGLARAFNQALENDHDISGVRLLFS